MFVVTSLVWFKLRVFRVDYCDVSVSPNTKIEFVNIKEQISVKLISAENYFLLESVDRNVERWKQRIRKQGVKGGEKGAFKVGDDQAFFNNYQKKREYISANMPIKEVIMNRVTRDK